MRHPAPNPDLETEIATLRDLGRPALIERWQGLYRADPPKGISRTLLIRAVAYEMQAKASRGLKPAARYHLRSAADSSDNVKLRAPCHLTLRPGTRLIREWNGVTYRVEAIDDGYVWKGETYRSLSAIARAITGARWSGPRFFGLRQERTS